MKLSKLLTPKYYRAPILTQQFKNRLVWLKWPRRTLRLRLPKWWLGVWIVCVLMIGVIVGVITHEQRFGSSWVVDQQYSNSTDVSIKAESDQEQWIILDNRDMALQGERISVVWAWSGQLDSTSRVTLIAIIWGVVIMLLSGGIFIVYRRIKK